MHRGSRAFWSRILMNGKSGCDAIPGQKWRKSENRFHRQFLSASLPVQLRRPVHVVWRGGVDPAFLGLRRGAANGCIPWPGSCGILAVVAGWLHGVLLHVLAIFNLVFFGSHVHSISWRFSPLLSCGCSGNEPGGLVSVRGKSGLTATHSCRQFQKLRSSPKFAATCH